MSCVAGVTLLQEQMHPPLFVGHFAESIFQFFSWFMVSVLSCTNLHSNEGTGWALLGGAFSCITFHHDVVTFCIFSGRKAFKQSLQDFVEIQVSYLRHQRLDSQLCGRIVWNLAKMTLRSMKVEEGYEICDTWTENQRSVHDEKGVI